MTPKTKEPNSARFWKALTKLDQEVRERQSEHKQSEPELEAEA